MSVTDPHDESVQYRVIDVHQHMPPVAADDMGPPDAGDLEERVAIMDDWGIDWACLLAPGGWPPTVTSREVNDRLVTYRQMHPDRYVAAIGAVHVVGGKRELAELERIATDPYLDGAAWHHKLQGANIDHPSMNDALRICQDAQMPAFVHCWHDSGPPEYPWQLADLAERFPEVTFLVLDSMSSMVFTGSLIQVARRCPNVWFDTAMLSPSGKVLETIVNAIGDTRVLLGCNPMGARANFNYPTPIYDVIYAELSVDAKRRILADNALKLLRLESPLNATKPA